jgi:hypothetical protein
MTASSRMLCVIPRNVTDWSVTNLIRSGSRRVFDQGGHA